MSTTDQAVLSAQVDDCIDDYDEERPDTTCENCNGTGGEPFDSHCTPCEECDGEGYKWWL